MDVARRAHGAAQAGAARDELLAHQGDRGRQGHAARRHRGRVRHRVHRRLGAPHDRVQLRLPPARLPRPVDLDPPAARLLADPARQLPPHVPAPLTQLDQHVPPRRALRAEHARPRSGDGPLVGARRRVDQAARLPRRGAQAAGQRRRTNHPGAACARRWGRARRRRGRESAELDAGRERGCRRVVRRRGGHLAGRARRNMARWCVSLSSST